MATTAAGLTSTPSRRTIAHDAMALALCQNCATPMGKVKEKESLKNCSEGVEEKSVSDKSGIVSANCKRPNHTKEKRRGLHPELKRKGKGEIKSCRIVGLDEKKESRWMKTI